MVSSFVCDNYDDERVMQQLIAKNCKVPVNRRPRLIVADFKQNLYDYKKYRPPFSEYSTVYEMLNISDHVIANTLFDQRKIESVLLLPNFTVGQEIVERNPNKCSEAFLLSGDNLKGLPSFRFYSCDNRIKPVYFVSNTQQVIESNTREIAELTEQANAIRSELKEITSQITENVNLKRDTDSRLHSMGKVKISLESQLREAQNIHIPEPIDLAVFEDEIEKITSDIDEIDNTIQSIEAGSAEKKTEYDRANAEKIKSDEESKQYNDQIDQIKSGFSDIENKRGSSKEAIKHYKNLLNQLVESEEKSLDDQLVVCERDLKNFTQLAVNLSHRIETTRSAKAIQIEEAAITKQIAESLKLHGDSDAIINEYKVKWGYLEFF